MAFELRTVRIPPLISKENAQNRSERGALAVVSLSPPFWKVTQLQGDSGDGKSKLMLYLAALLSKGTLLPFADEDESGESMSCT